MEKVDAALKEFGDVEHYLAVLHQDVISLSSTVQKIAADKISKLEGT